MLDKKLIKNKFKRSMETYDKNAFIQNLMAQKLIELIKDKKFKNILEIGSYTGILTKKLIDINPNFTSYTAIDIIKESKNYIKKIDNNIIFLNKDVEDFYTGQKFDLIIANASMQWCLDLSNTIKKLQSFLENEGIMAISLFSKNNFFEIKDIFNIGLNYPSPNEIKKIFDKEILIFDENYELNFDNTFDILKHLKLTGVNALKKESFSIKELKEKMKNYQLKYENKLTYNPMYVIYQRP